MKNSKLNYAAYIIVPFIISCIVGALVYVLLRNNRLQIDLDNLSTTINTFLGIWGALLGFIITAESILVGFKGSGNTDVIYKSRHYSTIMLLYSTTAVAILIFLLVFSFVLIFVKVTFVVLCIFIASIVMTFIYVIFCLISLFAIIRSALV